MKKVTVLGTGSWGTALSLVLADQGYQVDFWGRNEKILMQLQTKRENEQYLPGVFLPEKVNIERDLNKALENAEMVVLAVPSQAVRGVCRQINKIVSVTKPVIVNTAKGIEVESLLRLSEVIKQELSIDGKYISVLSGPSHAEEVGRRLPTAVVAAAENKEIAEFVQNAFMTSTFRVYTNPDIIGVEMGGALKNVIAIATGISDGLGFGDNSKAALITRGLTEIARLGSTLGGELLTFAGLSGIGDLVVTCTSIHSRNRRAGIALGQGQPLDKVLKEMGMVVEGIKTTEAAYALAKREAVDVPIITQLYKILFENLDPKQGVANLMGRTRTHEVEEVVFNRENW